MARIKTKVRRENNDSGSDGYERVREQLDQQSELYAKKLIPLDKTLFSQHRSGWNYAWLGLDCLQAKTQPEREQGICFDSFIERSHSWELNKNFDAGVVPYKEPWVGFVHNPPDPEGVVPEWWDRCNALEVIVERDVFKESMASCRGLFCLSEFVREWLLERYDIPVHSLIHPTETPELKFSMDRYQRNPDKMIVAVGFWLRKMLSIRMLPTRRLQKGHMLTTRDCWRLYDLSMRCSDTWNQFEGETTTISHFMSGEEYDELFSKNIVFLDLYQSSANNAIIECIVRNTPVVVNPLPAVVEYLGEDYPLYYSDLDEAAEKAEDVELIGRAYEYIRGMDKERFTVEYFLETMHESELYQSL